MNNNSKRVKLITLFSIIFMLLLVLIVMLLINNQNQDDTSKKDLTSSEINTATETADYLIEYKVTWNNSTHPQTIPNNAHVSPIVVISHAEKNDLFIASKPATEGVEIMAETGATKTLISELANNNSVFNVSVGNVVNAPGNDSVEIKVNKEHSLVSAVSMIAPSPDWFIGVENVDLFVESQWLEELEIVMNPYDAGTDSGETFTASDIDTNPAQSILGPRDQQFINASGENHFATLKFTKK